MRCSKLAFLYIPCQYRAKVFLLGIEALEPFALCGTRKLIVCGLAEFQKEIQEPPLHGGHLARIPEAVKGVLAYCFYHAVARSSIALFKNEQ